MDESIEKRITAFTSQPLRQHGIRAACMDDIARNTNIFKRTIYQIYTTKGNSINTCWWVYQSRIENTFHITRYGPPGILEYLWAVSKAYIENLYKAACVFWLDVSRHLEYKYIYNLYNRIWSDELEKTLSVYLKERHIIPDLEVCMFVESFTALFYNARVTECLPAMLHSSATFTLRRIMTESGIGLFDNIPRKNQITS